MARISSRWAWGGTSRDPSDQATAANLTKPRASPIPAPACNDLLRPADRHGVGPHASHDRILKWAEIAFRRVREA